MGPYRQYLVIFSLLISHTIWGTTAEFSLQNPYQSMHNKGLLLIDAIHGTYQNPALIVSSPRSQIQTSYQSESLGLDFFSVAGLSPYQYNNHLIWLGFSASTSEASLIKSESKGTSSRPTSSGSFTAADRQLQVSVAYPITPKLTIGARGSYRNREIGTYTAQAVVGDAGILFTHNQFKLGAHTENLLNNTLAWEHDVTEELLTKYYLQGSYTHQFLTGQLTLDSENLIYPALALRQNNLTLYSQFTLDDGALDGYTLGLNFQLAQVDIGYQYQDISKSGLAITQSLMWLGFTF